MVTRKVERVGPCNASTAMECKRGKAYLMPPSALFFPSLPSIRIQKHLGSSVRAAPANHRRPTHYTSTLVGLFFGSDPIRFHPSAGVLREGGASRTSPPMAGASRARARARASFRVSDRVLLSSLSQLRGGRGRRSPRAAAAGARGGGGARGWRRTGASAGGRPSSCSTRLSGSLSASVSSSPSSSTRCSSVSSHPSCVVFI